MMFAAMCVSVSLYATLDRLMNASTFRLLEKQRFISPKMCVLSYSVCGSQLLGTYWAAHDMNGLKISRWAPDWVQDAAAPCSIYGRMLGI